MSTPHRVLGAAVFWLFAAVALCHPAHAKIPGGSGTTYYFSPTGSDAANCTSQATACQTTTKYNSITFNCGDVALFQGGGTFAGTLQLYAVSVGGKWAAPCSPATPFTIGSYGTGQWTLNPTSGQNGVDIYDFSGVVIQNGIVTGVGAASTGVGLSIFSDITTTLNFFYFYNMNVSGFLNGCQFGTTADTATTGHILQNLAIINSQCHDNLQQGIQVYQNQSGTTLKTRPWLNVYVSGVQAYNNAGSSGICGHGLNIQAEAPVVQFSHFTNNGTGFSGCTGMIFYESKNAIAQFNESDHNHTNGAVDGDGFDCFDGGNMEDICRYNYGHDNDGACIVAFQPANDALWNNNTAGYNICQNNGVKNSFGELFIGTGGTMGVLNEYGNTLYNNVASNPIVQTSTNNTTGLSGVFSNNILVQGNASNRLIDFNSNNPTAFIVQGNDYSGSTLFRQNGTAYTTLPTWISGAATETYRGVTTALSASPSLTNAGGGATCFPSAASPTCPSAYTLQAGSAMLNAGQNLMAVFGLKAGGYDYYANTVPAPSSGNYDVGANQRSQ
jgi:hypothetical protein